MGDICDARPLPVAQSRRSHFTARWIIEWVRWSLWSISSRSSIYGLGLQPWTWPSHWGIVLGQRCIFQRVIINFHLVSPSYRHFPTSQFSPQLLDYSSPSTFFSFWASLSCSVTLRAVSHWTVVSHFSLMVCITWWSTLIGLVDRCSKNQPYFHSRWLCQTLVRTRLLFDIKSDRWRASILNT